MISETHHTIQIPEKNITMYMPRELAHCNREEYIKVCNLLYLWHQGVLTLAEFQDQCTYMLLNLKKGRRSIPEIEQEYMNSNISVIAQQCIPTFFDIKDKLGYQVKLNYVKNHIPEINLKGKTVVGPQDRFQGVKWGQYEDALNLYHLYHKYPDKKFLHMLLATFYLPKGTKYKEKKVEKNAVKFNHLNYGYLYGFYLFFSAIQLFITTASIIYEGKNIQLSLLFDSDISDDNFESQIPGLGIKALTYQLAETNIYGQVDNIREKDMWDVLFLLYELRKRDLDNKERMEQAQRNKN